MTLYEYKGCGCWLLPTVLEIKTVIDFSDQEWIQSYNSKLRFIFLKKELESHDVVFHLFKKIERLNFLLENEKLKTVQPHFLENSEFNDLVNEISKTKIESKRRALFQKFQHATRSHERLTAKHLPNSVEINLNTCTACDACSKICPTQALKIQKDKISGYQMNPILCDACGLCETVCETKSIKALPYERVFSLVFPFQENICAMCGHSFFFNPYQRNSAKNSLCHVCKKNPHPKGSLRIFDSE